MSRVDHFFLQIEDLFNFVSRKMGILQSVSILFCPTDVSTQNSERR